MSSSSWESSDQRKNSATKGSDASEPGLEQGPYHVLKTVKLTEREVRAATQLLNALAGLEGDGGGELSKILRKAAATNCPHGRELFVERARQTFASRSQRAQFFNKAMFGEAAWDMLLALYVTEQSGARHTVSGLLDLSGVAPTTALRWLDFLRKEGLVARRSSPTDGRVFFVELTDEGLKALDAYFAEAIVPTI
ncbi:MarR family transcriptional regulator [Sphingomonas sp.]|uniref:MarR family transcriptional regulator n=1 Tax=Sphingomonas sp. TaxID=28214 RepID=UPI001795A806|nr:MarR family transcriptional regulator [Sphingomonas sp.]MBA3512625.1 MarR family transcriptional regulator [Sphingomonas sp.]